jgi:hypothetical protein
MEEKSEQNVLAVKEFVRKKEANSKQCVSIRGVRV